MTCRGKSFTWTCKILLRNRETHMKLTTWSLMSNSDLYTNFVQTAPRSAERRIPNQAFRIVHKLGAPFASNGKGRINMDGEHLHLPGCHTRSRTYWKMRAKPVKLVAAFSLHHDEIIQLTYDIPFTSKHANFYLCANFAMCAKWVYQSVCSALYSSSGGFGCNLVDVHWFFCVLSGSWCHSRIFRPCVSARPIQMAVIMKTDGTVEWIR